MKFRNVVVLVTMAVASAALDRRSYKSSMDGVDTEGIAFANVAHGRISASSEMKEGHNESDLRVTNCQPSDVCTLHGGECINRQTICEGIPVPGLCKGKNCLCCLLQPDNQCLSEDDDNSVLWRKVDSTGTGIKEAFTINLSLAVTDIEAKFNYKMDYAITRINHLDCHDWNDSCQPWADRGECEKNPGYMIRVCPRACNVCDCYDKYEECPIYRDEDACNISAEFMRVICPVTCGFCLPLPFWRESRISGKPISPPAPISSTTAPKTVAT